MFDLSSSSKGIKDFNGRMVKITQITSKKSFHGVVGRFRGLRGARAKAPSRSASAPNATTLALNTVTGRVRSARNGGPAPPLSGVSKRCSIFEAVLPHLSLLMLWRRRRCEGCDASQHDLLHLLAPQLLLVPLLPRPLAPSAVIKMKTRAAVALLISARPRGDAPLRACVDVLCGHPRIFPRRRSSTASLR